MRLRQCPRETELCDALRTGRWPGGSDDSLLSHVELCESCQELRLILPLLRQDRVRAMQTMPLASAGLLWWRAQILERQAAIRQASRPIHVAITVSLLASVLVVLSVLLSLRWQIANWISSLVAVPVSAQSTSVSSPTSASVPVWFVLLALVGLAALCGIAVCTAVERE